MFILSDIESRLYEIGDSFGMAMIMLKGNVIVGDELELVPKKVKIN